MMKNKIEEHHVDSEDNAIFWNPEYELPIANEEDKKLLPKFSKNGIIKGKFLGKYYSNSSSGTLSSCCS